MLKRIIFMTCSPVFFLLNLMSDNPSSKFEKCPVPVWVKECDFSLEPISPKPSQVNIQYLLTDTQRNLEEKTLYWHFAGKPLTQNGISQLAQFTIDFNPDYQKLLIHTIRVYRDGKWLDRFDKSRLELLQREQNLENHVYGGELTLVHFLEDVRVGDIVEYACSFVGENPLFSSKSSGYIKLQEETTIEKISSRILSHPDNPFFFKIFHSSLQPRITDLSPTLREWAWEVISTPPCPYEVGQPFWHYPHARIQISQYKSWQDVAKPIVSLFALPDNFNAQPSSAMLDLIKKWKESSQDMAEQATLALKFVQDEIRYLGFEDGIGAFKPTDPRIVLERRFGDCKDKTLLLQALLKLLGIHSTPVLIDSINSTRLPESLPCPFAFNHVILRVEIGNSFYWVDPTLTLQGGSLENIHFPDYKWGLPVSDQTTKLIALPKPIIIKPTEISTTFFLTSPDSANLTIKTTYYGNIADRIRRLFVGLDLKKVSDDSLNAIQQRYDGASLIDLITISDDRTNNILSMVESYKIPTKESSRRKILKIHMDTYDHYFDKQINLERSTPYALPYPLWVKEHIHIENPFCNWTLMSNDLTRKHESFQYQQLIKADGKTADLYLELKYLKDHVQVDAVRDYWNLFKEIENNAIWDVTISDPQIQPAGSASFNSFQMASFIVIGLLFLAIRYYFYRKNRQHNPTD